MSVVAPTPVIQLPLSPYCNGLGSACHKRRGESHGRRSAPATRQSRDRWQSAARDPQHGLCHRVRARLGGDAEVLCRRAAFPGLSRRPSILDRRPGRRHAAGADRARPAVQRSRNAEGRVVAATGLPRRAGGGRCLRGGLPEYGDRDSSASRPIGPGAIARCSSATRTATWSRFTPIFEAAAMPEGGTFDAPAVLLVNTGNRGAGPCDLWQSSAWC